MDVTTYRTYVSHLPATRSGLSPAQWSIQHVCNRCQDQVATDALIAHSRSHALVDAVVDDSRRASSNPKSARAQ
jgi:hypothetical protein